MSLPATLPAKKMVRACVGCAAARHRGLGARRGPQVCRRSLRQQGKPGRAVARIMHGISSPMFSARDWSRTPAWRRLLQVDFSHVRAIATAELIRLRM
eukprot:m.163801 g.163801  ORF g.163801 m.163801 type:complete len:98 (+) comp15220_c0_seq1:41-334(+)